MALTRPLVTPAWAESGDRVQPTNAEIQAGWPLTSIPPSRQRFNWAMWQMHQGVRYLTRRGLPDWSAQEAYEVGDCCLAANGKSYRCIAAHTNFEPSATPAKWERWAYSESELDAKLASLLPYGAPVVCPNAGPDANANKEKVHKSALGEYWMWLGDAWRVVAGLHYDMRYAGSSNLSAGMTTLWTWIPPRAGHVHLNINCNSSTSSPNDMLGAVIAFNGVKSVYDVSFAPVTGQPIAASGSINVFLDPSSVVEFKVQLISSKGVSAHLAIQYQS